MMWYEYLNAHVHIYPGIHLQLDVDRINKVWNVICKHMQTHYCVNVASSVLKTEMKLDSNRSFLLLPSELE